MVKNKINFLYFVVQKFIFIFNCFYHFKRMILLIIENEFIKMGKTQSLLPFNIRKKCFGYNYIVYVVKISFYIGFRKLYKFTKKQFRRCQIITNHSHCIIWWVSFVELILFEFSMNLYVTIPPQSNSSQCLSLYILHLRERE